MTAARTPGPWWIDDDGFLVRMDDESDSAYDLNDAAALLNSHEDSHDALVAHVATLREALRACITDEGARCYQTGSVHALDCRIKGINAEARAALAKDGTR